MELLYTDFLIAFPLLLFNFYSHKELHFQEAYIDYLCVSYDPMELKDFMSSIILYTFS